ncbi:hypothetical protein PV11_01522 [Exophiala sideris]|uniref:Amidohydrolase-related domain-containing protein n=1 Tax=Exophiala sideris TaxID=1016849 RepID=A0A0D1YWD9_9EURO|nr:hypothetical protein PV11_01522 [Exophiala sideris]
MALTGKYILLRGGTVLTHSTDENVIPLYDTDVLVHDDTIVKIGKAIDPPSDAYTEVIECHGKIVSPGFVDTHHHVWQTQLKGRHADQGLVAYMVSGNIMSYAYKAEDAYWGQLSGCLEAINAGTTLVLDHAHIAYTPEHATAALSATVGSGIRSILAYTNPLRMSQWDQSSCIPDQDLLPKWAVSQLSEWLEKYNHNERGNAVAATVEVGMGFDLWFLPKDVVLPMLTELGEKGLRVLTTHVGCNAFQGQQSPVPMFSSYDLLQHPYPPSDKTSALPFLLLSHCGGIPKSDLSLLASTGTPISSTPDTESHMGMGFPVSLHSSLRNSKTANVSIGVDLHTFGPASIPLQARALLQLTRLERNSHLLAKDTFPAWDVRSSSEEAFNLATIRGARCLGLESQVGSIAEGKKADLVVFDAKGSVGMLAAAEHDPVTAIIRFSESADIETVIINGTVRKRNGKLVDVAVSRDGVAGKGVGGDADVMQWSDVAEEVRRSQKDIQARIERLSIDQGRKTLLGMFHVDQEKLVDAL